MKYNNVDDEAVKIAANFISYIEIKKGEYVFKQGDESDVFYGIINGKISIRDEWTEYIEKDLTNLVTSNKSLINKDLFRTTTYIGSPDFQGYRRKATSKRNNIVEVKYMFEEKLVFSEGHCFGHWGLIFDKPRSSSAYALEDTKLWTLDRDSFDLSFYRCLSKAEADRKVFLLKRMKPFKELPYSKFETLYTFLTPRVIYCRLY